MDASTADSSHRGHAHTTSSSALLCTPQAGRHVASPNGRVHKKEIVGAIIARQRAIKQRADGSTVRFQENACVLMKRDLSGPIATRVNGPVARELRENRFMKVVMMASRVL